MLALALTIGTTEIVILLGIALLLWITRGGPRIGTSASSGRELGNDLRLMTGPDGETASPASRAYKRAVERRRKARRRMLRVSAQERADAWVTAQLAALPDRLQALAAEGKDAAFFPFAPSKASFPAALFPDVAADPIAHRRDLTRVAGSARKAVVRGLRELGVRATFTDGAVSSEKGSDLRYGLQCRW